MTPEEGSGAPARRTTAELTAAELVELRSLLDRAFGDEEDERFRDEDWAHTIGGTHILLRADGRLVAHAAVIERVIQVGGQPLRTGYVEGVATSPDRQGQGLGSIVMAGVNALIREQFELGVLGTGSHHFYERLGWRTWQGASSVRTADGERPTPEDDGYLMVLATPASPPLDLGAPISCEWRPGDVW